MFVQVIQGRVTDPEHHRRQQERWIDELKPGATGYLGGTWGMTPDGRGVTIARFESADAARANSDRPDQGAWWADTEKAFEDVQFQESEDVDELLGGGSDAAGFVQVIQGRVKDESAAREVFADADDRLAEMRPDILGGLMAWHGGGAFTQVMYFRTEDEARTGERSGSDDELDQQYREMMDGEPTFLDLADPQFD